MRVKISQNIIQILDRLQMARHGGGKSKSKSRGQLIWLGWHSGDSDTQSSGLSLSSATEKAKERKAVRIYPYSRSRGALKGRHSDKDGQHGGRVNQT